MLPDADAQPHVVTTTRNELNHSPDLLDTQWYYTRASAYAAVTSFYLHAAYLRITASDTDPLVTITHRR